MFFACRHLERARIAIDTENWMGTSERRRSTNKYWVDICGQRYLQVEQVNNEFYRAKSQNIDNEEEEDDD